MGRMYTSRGANPTEVGDIDVVEHDGVLHCFHLTLPNHDLVSHVTSRDGLKWEPAPPALRTGEPGSCDDDMIWTMHVVRAPEGAATGAKFHMYYTGCSTAERGQVQRVALATSEDLYAWTRHPRNPLLASARPHYNDDRTLVGFISFRDPFVFIEDGVWHMLVTGRTADGPRFRRGAVVHAVSRDGVQWELQPPLYAPQQFEDIEVPSLIRRDGRYYLFFHDFNGHNPYRIAESLDGPWLAPQRDMLLPDRNFVFRFATWRGQTLLFHTLRSECDWKRRAPSAGVACLAPPKEVHTLPNGELALRSFAGWSEYHDGVATTLPGLSARSVQGQRVRITEPEPTDFVLDTHVTLDAGQAIGLVFRTDRGLEHCNWLRLNYAEQRIELHRQTVYDSSFNRFKLRKTLVQSAPATLTPGKRLRLRLLACREYIEVSLDDVVHLSAVTYANQRGHIGAFVENGAGEVEDMKVQPINPPWTD